MKSFGLTETKLFHFHRIFRNWGWGWRGSSEPPLDLPPPLQILCYNSFSSTKLSLYQNAGNNFQIASFLLLSFRPSTEIVREYDQKLPHHKPQTTPWHREEEPLNRHETPGRQTKQSNQPSLPHQDYCNTRMDIK